LLVLASMFSVATLGLAAHMTSTVVEGRVAVDDFEGLAIAVSALTILCLPVFRIVGALRKKALITSNVVEVPVLGCLSIIWLANGALYADLEGKFYPSGFACNQIIYPILQTFCSEFRAVEALSFLTWIFLMGYVIVVIILCLVGKSRGNDVWLVGASEADY
ncbi:hypothetical protein L218DRAFT_805057, partial [Marasmius fiardii PR-910]